MLLVLAGLLLVFMIVMNIMGKKTAQKNAAQFQTMLDEQLVPGAWVHTKIGFFGRFVDIDGDVLILETEDGVETYWSTKVISSVGELPFEIEQAPSDSEDLLLDETEALDIESSDEDIEEYRIEGELTVEDVLDASDNSGNSKSTDTDQE